ncbi:MAG: hypothetical protein MUC93_02100 [Bacteroidales bacterium]|nr:hypothetical protein [Bacteroidales bacterium]
MKKSVYKSGTLLLTSLFIFSFALSAQEELTKEFHKEYAAKQGSKLELNNRYGNIVVQTSESDQVVIDVKVTVKYPNRERAEKLMSYIDVQFTEEPGLISAKTVIDDKFSFTGWSSASRKFSIDYFVKMPVWLDLGLANKYGNSEIDDLAGYVDLDVKYGNITAAKLTRGNEKPLSTINISYGNCSIEEAGWIEITTRYCGNFSIAKSRALSVDSKYSKLQLGSVSSVAGEIRYDNLKIDDINNLVLDGGYTEVNIGTLTKKLDYNGEYGSFNIDRIPAGFESIEIDTRYTGVNLGIEENASYYLEAKTSFCGVKYNEENFLNKRRIVENNSAEISGIVGKEEKPSGTVKVEASYGNVKLY